MSILKDFTRGLLSVLNVTSAPMLYRYPYRISAEGMHADWLHIGQDILAVIGRLEMGKSDLEMDIADGEGRASEDIPDGGQRRPDPQF